jgi:acyl carrier protein
MNLDEDVMTVIAETGRLPLAEMNAGLKIYDSGLISSLAMLELMARLEKQYGIAIRPEELIPDNFSDVRAIIDFVRRKTS